MDPDDHHEILQGPARTPRRNRIARFKIPRRVFFVDVFPMTGSGKIQKYLREQAQNVVSG
jgi:fatty-acyl-CoA synthase